MHGWNCQVTFDAGNDSFVLCRVYDVSSASLEPIQVLKGHKARAFNVVWSPLLPAVFVSGSDDFTLRVWQLESPKVLISHKFVHLSTE